MAKRKTKAQEAAVPVEPPPPPGGYNLTAIPIQAAAALLSKEGQCAIAAEMLERDVKAGAPTNQDGTLNLVAYAAWLLKEGD